MEKHKNTMMVVILASMFMTHVSQGAMPGAEVKDGVVSGLPAVADAKEGATVGDVAATVQQREEQEEVSDKVMQVAGALSAFHGVMREIREIGARGCKESENACVVGEKESDERSVKSDSSTEEMLKFVSRKITEKSHQLHDCGYDLKPVFREEQGRQVQDGWVLQTITIEQDASIVALQDAIESGVISELRALIECDSSCVHKDFGDDTLPILYAALKGNTNVVQVLLEEKADPNTQRKKDGATPLLVACQEGHWSMVKLLLKYKASLAAQDVVGGFPLWRAFSHSHEDMQSFLLQQKADVNQKTNRGKTLLMRLCNNADRHGVCDLVAAGADIHASDLDGTTALHCAVLGECAAIVTFLLSSQADPNAENKAGGTALMFAATQGHARIAQLLLEGKADAGRVNECGHTALDYASNDYIRVMLERALAQKTSTPKIVEIDEREVCWV